MSCLKCSRDNVKIRKTGKYIGICTKCIANMYYLESVKNGKRQEFNKNYRKKNIEKIREYDKKYKRGEKCKLKRQENRKRPHVIEREKREAKEYYAKNKEKRIKNVRDWEKRNPDKARKKNRESLARRKLDPIKSLADKIRHSIKATFRKRGIKKIGASFDYLNYTPLELFNRLSIYLEKPCQDCKSTIITNKTGTLDHIYPTSLCKTQEEVIHNNRLDNLRLICFPCNCKKNDNIIQIK